jgi:hypothetical protein
MVESFAPTDSMASCSDYSEQEDTSIFDITETLLDHYVGAVRITGVNWCESLGVISLSFGDGSVKNYLVEIE